VDDESCAAKRSAATAALLAGEVFVKVGHAQWVLGSQSFRANQTGLK